MAHVHPWSSRRLNCYESQRTCSRQTSTPGSSVPPKTGASRSTTTAQYVPLTCCREATSVGAPVRRSGKELLKADRTRMICLEISHRRKPLDSTGGLCAIIGAAQASRWACWARPFGARSAVARRRSATPPTLPGQHQGQAPQSEIDAPLAPEPRHAARGLEFWYTGCFTGDARKAEVRRRKSGRVAERLMATGCKPVAPCGLRRFESSPVHQNTLKGRCSSVGRARPW